MRFRFERVMTSILFVLAACYLIFAPSVKATVDPLASANNKYGIHLISVSDEEIDGASKLVNSNGGDWGYVTILIESTKRDNARWSKTFQQLRKKHLIPLVRIATQPEGNHWKVPDEGEEQAWADFLDSLPWPTQNRYIIVYNEPNQAQEWGGAVDASTYTKALDKTIDALKKKSPDFFVLNAGLDASAPQKLPLYADEQQFLKQMNDTVPGIFNKLDGWVSHSYPNPGFSGSPYAVGRGTTSTYLWEMQILSSLGLNKPLPIFITETGWKHAEGLSFDRFLPDSATVADYYKYAFDKTWVERQIVAVTPFLLDYQEVPFDHFSFKKPTGEKQDVRILGLQYPEYYEQYQAIVEIPKQSGRPVQKNDYSISNLKIFSSLVADESYTFTITLKNTGQSTWNEYEPVVLKILSGAKELSAQDLEIPLSTKVEPGQEYTFSLPIKAPEDGTVNLSLNLFIGSQTFLEPAIQQTIQIKQPVTLIIKTALKWKGNPAGEYLIKLSTAIGDTFEKVLIDNKGSSAEIQARYILPDYSFDFTLNKPFYRSKTIHQTVHSGTNELNFETLEPDWLEALAYPKELWKLLPWSK